MTLPGIWKFPDSFHADSLSGNTRRSNPQSDSFGFLSSGEKGGMIGVALLLGALLGEPATSTRAQAAECVAVSILGLASGLALASSKDRGLHERVAGGESMP
jgi:hypothetical protein